MLLLCFEWCGILVWFSHSLLAFFNLEEEKKSWKSTKLSKQREQRSRRGKRDILFERFSLKFKGEFFSLKHVKETKKRNKHFAIIAHNIITEHII